MVYKKSTSSVKKLSPTFAGLSPEAKESREKLGKLLPGTWDQRQVSLRAT